MKSDASLDIVAPNVLCMTTNKKKDDKSSSDAGCCACCGGKTKDKKEDMNEEILQPLPFKENENDFQHFFLFYNN